MDNPDHDTYCTQNQRIEHGIEILLEILIVMVPPVLIS